MKLKIKKYIEKEKLLNSNDKVIVGLSGGADSTVLLHILHSLGYKCIVAHCNFHLRGEESQRDEQFAAGLAASLNLPFFKKDFDTVNLSKKHGISIEMAAREVRYQWFSELKTDLKADAIAVAHHCDDSIETLLLNLIRGTGIKGLTGIQPKKGPIVRPLLCITKKEILHYAQTENLSFITDSSNEQDTWLRNKIRLQVIPLLETINPSVRESITHTMNNLNETFKIYDTEIQKAIREVFNPENGSISISFLKKFPSPKSILFELLKNYGFSKEVISDIHRAMDSHTGKTFFAKDYYIVKNRDEFLLSPVIMEKDKEYLIQENETFLEIPVKMKIILLPNDPVSNIDKNQNTACLDFDKLHFPLTLRKWKRGDRFMPLGMNNFQKLSDFFTTKKFSKLQKEQSWILTSGKDIVWIVNNRIDERFKINKNTKKRYILKLL